MITTDRELIESALVKETRTLQRQELLKQLWRMGPPAPRTTDEPPQITPPDFRRSTLAHGHVNRLDEDRNRTR
jgi:hypothetical protein